MALQDREEQELAKIAQQLSGHDPRFAKRLAEQRPALVTLSPRTRFILGLITTYLIGLVAIIAGVTIASVALIVLGAIIIPSFPVALIVQAWRKPPRRNTSGQEYS